MSRDCSRLKDHHLRARVARQILLLIGIRVKLSAAVILSQPARCPHDDKSERKTPSNLVQTWTVIFLSDIFNGEMQINVTLIGWS